MTTVAETLVADIDSLLDDFRHQHVITASQVLDRLLDLRNDAINLERVLQEYARSN